MTIQCLFDCCFLDEIYLKCKLDFQCLLIIPFKEEMHTGRYWDLSLFMCKLFGWIFDGHLCCELKILTRIRFGELSKPLDLGWILSPKRSRPKNGYQKQKPYGWYPKQLRKKTGGPVRVVSWTYSLVDLLCENLTLVGKTCTKKPWLLNHCPSLFRIDLLNHCIETSRQPKSYATCIPKRSCFFFGMMVTGWMGSKDIFLRQDSPFASHAR